jgi:Tol biopolymer transport system component
MAVAAVGYAALGQTTLAAPERVHFFGVTPQFAISPTGQQVVFVAFAPGKPSGLWLRPIGAASARQLPGTEHASYPFWAADGRAIGFFASGKLKTIAVDGGTPVVVCDAPTGRGGTWNDRGEIVFASGINDPLRKVATSGGTPTPVTVVDVPRENSHRWPQFLPDGRRVLFWAGAGTSPAQLKVASLDSGAIVSLGPGEANAAYAAGYLFVKVRDALTAQRLDPVTLAKSGESATVAAPISTDAGSAFASFSVSGSGAVAYTRGTTRPQLLTWFDRNGRVAGTIGERGQYTNVTLSPDGTRVAVSLTAGEPANRDIWIMDAKSGTRSRVTTDPAVDATPIWSPDGTQIAFSSQRAGPYQIYSKPSTAAATVSDDARLPKADTASIATDWSPDGRFIAYTRSSVTTGLDIWMLPLSGSRPPFPVLETRAAEDNAAFSPDGRWLAYQSNDTGRDEVYVRRWEATGGPVRVSTNGGSQPRWRGDGTELFFLAADGSVMCATIRLTGDATVGEPRTIVPAAMTLVIRHAYAVQKDGQRVLMPVLDQQNPSVIEIVEKWPAVAIRQHP